MNVAAVRQARLEVLLFAPVFERSRVAFARNGHDVMDASGRRNLSRHLLPCRFERVNQRVDARLVKASLIHLELEQQTLFIAGDMGYHCAAAPQIKFCSLRLFQGDLTRLVQAHGMPVYRANRRMKSVSPQRGKENLIVTIVTIATRSATDPSLPVRGSPCHNGDADLPPAAV